MKLSMNEYWVARDLEGPLYLYKKRPKRETVAFFPVDPNDNSYFSIDSELFPEITWENSPVKVELKVKQ